MKSEPHLHWHVVDGDERLRSSPDRLTLPAQRREITDGDYYQSDVNWFRPTGAANTAPSARMFCQPDGAQREVLSAGGRPLSGGVNGVQRLARRHKEPVALWGPQSRHCRRFPATECGQSACPQVTIPSRRCNRRNGRRCSRPHISVDIAAHAVGTAFHPVNHTVGEQFLVG